MTVREWWNREEARFLRKYRAARRLTCPVCAAPDGLTLADLDGRYCGARLTCRRCGKRVPAWKWGDTNGLEAHWREPEP